MRYRWVVPVLAACAVAIEARAQSVALGVGAGPAYADGVGWTGLAAVDVRWRALIVRGDAHGVYVPGGGASILYGGVAVGAALSVAGDAARPYLLATLAKGVDLREADATAAVGVAAGLVLPRSHAFAELRYENSLQRANPFYYTLPEHQVSAYVGVRIGRPGPPPN